MATNEQTDEQPSAPAVEATKDPRDERPGASLFPIVGIGASAGGLEAISQLLAALPEKTGMAFIIVIHLDPHHESHLQEVLAKVTRIPIMVAANGTQVRPDHVYVIPPNTEIAISQGKLVVGPRSTTRAPHLPIDHLFRSLAEDQRSRAIGVVLSGTGSDGTLGVAEIKAIGGITFAQDERTARQPSMPHNAADTGSVDFILPPEKIAQRLLEIGSHPYLAPAEEETPSKSSEDDVRKVLTVVRQVTRVDFSLYRDTTIRRRIMRRMTLRGETTLDDYVQFLERDRDEVQALYNDLLINVTGFFRDPEVYDALKELVFPALFKDRPATVPLRIWVPGCSTGQEAYSVIITLLEFLDDKPSVPPIHVFATDLSETGALEKARAGVYPESIEAEVSPERLQRFFKKEDHEYRIDKTIRDMCVFARQNVAADPPFSHLDLISCRNLLIYLSTSLQQRVIPTFHYALQMPGFLVLGPSESVGEYQDLFEVVDRKHKIYSRKSPAGRPYPYFAATDHILGGLLSSRRSEQTASALVDFQKETDRVLLSRFVPPGVLVDENHDIIQFRGQTSKYLEHPTGDPTTNVLRMAREGLFLDLRSALAEAKKENAVARRNDIRVLSDEHDRRVNLEVIPVRPPGGNAPHFFVIFQDIPPSTEPTPKTEDKGKSAAADSVELRRLRQELVATKEYLQSLIEQQDAANEELRSANEEIMSSNEELQSTNEELETAKEELFSANEELTTVNEQLQRRNEELGQLNNDMSNLLSSTSISIVMVGSDLRIRRFTAPAKKVMNLLPSDVGRPIGHIKPMIVAPDLERMVEEVIESNRGVEHEVRSRNGRWYSLRILPYRVAERKIDGAVIVIVEIDQLKRAQDELEKQAATLRQQASLIELSQDAIIVRSAADNKISFWNRGAEIMYGWSQREALGKTTVELLKTETPLTPNGRERLDTWEGELHQTRRDGQKLIVHSRQVLARDDSHSTVLEINRDISERTKTEAALRDADRQKDEFLAVLAHELRNPLAPIRNFAEVLRLAGDDPVAVRKVSEPLERQVRQLTHIVGDLLDMSRIFEHKIELNRSRILLSDAVQTAKESCLSVLTARGHHLTIKLPGEPVYLDADPVRLVQVFVNLLNNAIKFTDPGGRISLTAELAGKNGPLRVNVRDNGIGIRPELMPHIFQMFTQGDRSRGRLQGGLGVGLTLVKSLVEMHGGRVEAHSDGQNRGTEFLVELPVAPPAPAGKEAPPTPAPQASSRRILVVDDNADQAESMSMLLTMCGHDVRSALDGPSALKVAESFAPEAAIVDIGLPGMNGYEVARQLRALPGGDKVLLIAQTGWGKEEDRKRSQEAGFDHHFVKPTDLDALRNLLATGRKN